ncbi:Multidrug resistance-associated protein 1 [Dissophora globulifera]|uniref:Multidrug resistance-associated protein 1 n=1 Tax=Dissophora globulifera TaxID=979702 RepID=A0A9P6UYD1_9FUNG|nr:Multidrug resistance-associated protein 1 [Dissophora globulifera]
MDDTDWEKPTAYDQANLFSRFCFHFLQHIISLGYRKQLNDDDIANMMPLRIRTISSYNFISRVWDRHLQKRKLSKKSPSLLWVVLKAGGWSWIPVIFFASMESILEYVSPVLLDAMLNFMASYSTDQPQPTSLGLILAFGMLATAILSSLSSGQYYQLGTNLGIEFKSGLTSMIYRKALKLSPGARREATVGEITNHMSVDAERISQAVLYLPQIFTAPFEVAIGMYLLYRQLGPSAFTGLGVVVLVIPIQGLVARVLMKAKDKKLEAMDGRIRLLTDVLSGIRAVKLYSWERSFSEKVNVYRKLELKSLQQIGVTVAIMMIMYSSMPSLMSLLSFVVYALAGGPNGTRGTMSPQVVFVSITLFGRFSRPIGRASSIISQSVTLKVAVKRIQSFLLQEELDEDQVEYRDLPSVASGDQTDNSVSTTAIQVTDGTFSWGSTDTKETTTTTPPLEKSEVKEKEKEKEGEVESTNSEQRPTLSGINLSIPHGNLTVVMGRVGQGKSSLLSAIIGDMYKLQGRVQINGRCAYVPQQAWIINATVRENIVFGREFEQERYNRVLSAAGLLPDLEILAAGDQTEIGERGINLSGGQKQRVSLARAAYQDADVYLLDDPLSAVDAHVDQHLWDNLIGPNGLLKGKARLLITHGVHHLSEADQIVVIRDGSIDEVGSFTELMTAQGSFQQLVEEYTIDQKKAGEETDAKTSHFVDDSATVSEAFESATQRKDVAATATHDAIVKEDDNAELVMQEAAAVGSVGWKVFKGYAEASTYLFTYMGVMGFVFSQVSQIGISLWLQDWASREDRGDEPPVGKFLGVYAALVMLYVIMDMGANTTILIGGNLRASRILHENLLTRVFRLPMSVGRIINRFSSDIDNLDELMPIAVSDVYFFLTTVLGTIVVIAISVPIFLAVVPFLIAFYILIQRYYIRTSRQVKRLHSISKSPLYQHFGETLSGVSTIRAMRVHESFIFQNAIKSDRSSNAYFVYSITIRWLHIRLELMGAVVVFATALFSVLGRETLGPAMSGLALSYALNATFAITYLVKSFSEMQNQLVSIERIQEYSTKNQEAPSILPADSKLPADWPTKGRVVFKNYSTRYRQGMDLVLKKVSFEVLPAEKVGVVGRTGAGKSSLTLALFRIIEAANSSWAKASHNGPDSQSDDAEVEPLSAKASEKAKAAASAEMESVHVEEDGGSIEIDGVDIATVGLEHLRRHLAIIPQDPILFSGSVRDNLDPFHEATDAELWEALERAYLKDHITSLAGGLSYEVAQNGENFSVGQRSLICLARALLRKAKVLILDEATAAVDVETDELIQRTIREEFKDRTILTIAHRIKTIMDSDKILVLERGRVEEYDTPSVLLQRQGLFYSLAKQAGQVM